MKCKNCGFEFDGKFCNMCGTPAEPITGNNLQSQNPYINNSVNQHPTTTKQAAIPQSKGTFQNFQQGNFTNIPAQPQQSNFANAPVQPQQSNFANAPVQPQQGNFANAPVQPQQGNFANAPVQPQQSGTNGGYVVNNRQGFVNTPINGQSNYVKMPMQPTAQKSSGKAAKIAISCIVGGIVLAGIVIMTVSAIANSFAEQKTDPIDTGNYMYDSNQYHINETADTSFGKITLTDVDAQATITSSDVVGQYTFTFKIQNTSGKEQEISYKDFNVISTDDTYEYSFTNIESKDYPSSKTIAPHSTDTFTICRHTSEYQTVIPLKITYKYTTADNDLGSVIFIKGGEQIEERLFSEGKTDFGYAKITQVKKPSESDIRKNFFEYEYLDATFDPSEYEDCDFYELTLEFRNNTKQFCTLTSVSGIYSLSSSDGFSSVIYPPIALAPDNYSYSLMASDDGYLYKNIDPETTAAYKLLMPVNKESDTIKFSFSFSNNDTVTFSTNSSELNEKAVK